MFTIIHSDKLPIGELVAGMRKRDLSASLRKKGSSGEQSAERVQHPFHDIISLRPKSRFDGSKGLPLKFLRLQQVLIYRCRASHKGPDSLGTTQ